MRPSVKSDTVRRNLACAAAAAAAALRPNTHHNPTHAGRVAPCPRAYDDGRRGDLLGGEGVVELAVERCERLGAGGEQRPPLRPPDFQLVRRRCGEARGGGGGALGRGAMLLGCLWDRTEARPSTRVLRKFLAKKGQLSCIGFIPSASVLCMDRPRHRMDAFAYVWLVRAVFRIFDDVCELGAGARPQSSTFEIRQLLAERTAGRWHRRSASVCLAYFSCDGFDPAFGPNGELLYNPHP